MLTLKKPFVSSSHLHRSGIGTAIAGTLLMLAGCSHKAPVAPPSSSGPSQAQMQQRQQFMKDHPNIKPPPGIANP